MAVINDKYKFMYLCEPHTASRSTRDALMTLETSRETSTYHHINVARALHNHYLTLEQAREYFFFTTIRNPHDLLVTKWFVSNHQRHDFFKFIRGHVKTMKEDTLFWRFHREVNTFIRYERLEEGLNKILSRLGAPSVQLPYKKEYKTEGKGKWRDEWSARMARWAREHYPDIDRYGYLFDYDVCSLEPLIEPKDTERWIWNTFPTKRSYAAYE